jgi:hypothetical protein
MTKAQVRAELQPAGFETVREFDRLPWQHLLFMGLRTGPREGASDGSPDEDAPAQRPGIPEK